MNGGHQINNNVKVHGVDGSKVPDDYYLCHNDECSEGKAHKLIIWGDLDSRDYPYLKNAN